MSSSADDKSAMEASRLEVMECEKEIQSIKSSLKSITSSGNNSLQVSVHKIAASGEDSAAPGTFKIHLSSPIEERTITKLFDPLDPAAEGSIVTFEQVETSNALLTVEAFSNGADDDLVKVGTSAAHDLLPLCQDLDADGDKISSTVEIAIVSEPSEESSDDKPALENQETDEWEDAVDEEKDVDDDAAGETKAEEPKETKLQLPLCTLSVQLEYTPSANDKRDSLYEKLNEVSKRKAAAIEKLRQSAAAVNRAKMAEAVEGKGKEGNVVKAGFLNKSKPAEAKPVPFWKRWYEKTIGPKSMLWVVGPIAKNYVIFIGCSVFFHYKGDLLALPPPV